MFRVLGWDPRRMNSACGHLEVIDPKVVMPRVADCGSEIPKEMRAPNNGETAGGLRLRVSNMVAR